MSHYDPNVIHECSECSRSYAIRPIENMNHWHFYNAYCSAWCAMPTERREQWGYTPAGDDSVLLYLLDRAQLIYRDLMYQMKNHGRIINPHYWYGWHYEDAHPYRFASEFMNRTERSLFLSKHERQQYARYLFGLTNQMHYGADAS